MSKLLAVIVSVALSLCGIFALMLLQGAEAETRYDDPRYQFGATVSDKLREGEWHE